MKALSKPSRIPFETIQGYYTDIRESLRHILTLYTSLHENPSSDISLEWFGRPNHFQISFGGDGAPIGTESGAVSHLVSVLNAGKRVLGRDHNFLVSLAGTNKEEHPEIIQYLKQVRVWINELEVQGITINDVEYTISFELLPVDQKYLAIVSGELSNAATYPSSFGVVNKKDILLATDIERPLIGWNYEKRVADA